ncbi:MAG: InlB B-repeat-containing protein [Clostridia bacterium]|nr:InlB B-repeat-containing protein [Clostridia bacterium]
MKKIFALFILTVLSALLFASCGEETPDTVTVTFRVNGETSSATVAYGQIPAFDGEIQWERDGVIYRISRWDKEFSPATKDTEYVAVVTSETVASDTVTIRWQTQSGIFTTKVRKGQMPTPPDVEASVTTESAVYTFKDSWTPAIAPASTDVMYRANYKSVPRQYDVTFLVGETVAAVVPTDYGTVPTPPQVQIPEGNTFVSWGTLRPVSGKATYVGLFSDVETETVNVARDALAGDDIKDRATAALFFAEEEYEKAGAFAGYVTDYLRWFIAGGNEPFFAFEPNFYQPMAAATIAVARKTPHIWNEFTAAEVEKLTFMMQCFAVSSAQATDDRCEYLTGADFAGNYRKVWNPNYPLSNVPEILFCADFFGSADATNAVLRDFDYDTYIAKFKEYGWTKALSCWGEEIDLEEGTVRWEIAQECSDSGNIGKIVVATIVEDDGHGHYVLEYETTGEDVAANNYSKLGLGFKAGEKRRISYTSPRAMMMDGGEVYCLKALYRNGQYAGKPAGSGISVRAIGERGYRYKNYTLDDVAGIWNSLLSYNYSGGACVKQATYDSATGNYLCYIYDKTDTPVAGMIGMMREFDSSGRSSLSYTQVDFALCVAVTSALETLGLYDSSAAANKTLSKQVWIGNTDFLYKAKHGYVSYSGTAVRGNPTPTYGAGPQYLLWKYRWEHTGGMAYTLEGLLDEIAAAPVKNIVSEYAKANSTNDLTDTMTGKTYSDDVLNGSHYWQKDLYISYSFLYEKDTVGEFEIRMRSFGNDIAANRGKIIAYKNGVMTFPLFIPIGDSPVSLSLGGYGWHRLTFAYHQETAADTENQTVEHTLTLTVILDGEKMGEYAADVLTFAQHYWLLYDASYNEDAADYVSYADNGNKVSMQIYRAGAFNKPAAWIYATGDSKIFCGNAAEKATAIRYDLDGGSFAADRDFLADGGYVALYNVTETPHYVLEGRTVRLTDPVKEGCTFDGWYTDGGERVTEVSYTETPITLRAKWTAN